MKKILFLDVDGVLVDSRKEIMLSSWNEYNLWKQELGLPYEPFSTNYDSVDDYFLNARNAFGKLSHKGYHRVAINPLILAGFNPKNVSINLIQQLSEADENLKTATMRRLKFVRDRWKSQHACERIR
jgi:beta-phosphoglucomutase-like phosphatase (HAD superfamily)